jgi:hypothetical protein
MNKYEKLIEYIINDNEAKAKELFHEIVVEKSRDIYESLMDEENVEEVGGNAVDEFVDEITNEVNGDEMAEGDEDPASDVSDLDGTDSSATAGDDMSMGDDGGDTDPATKGDVMDLASQLDQLTAKFDELMSQTDGGQDNSAPTGDTAMDMGGTQDSTDEQFSAEAQFEAVEEEVEEDVEEDVEESVKESRGTRSETELMREYVEKIKEFYKGDNTEGSTVGTGGNEPTVNTANPVAGKNDFGGTAGNLNQGGAEQNPDGTAPKQANNYGTAKKGELPGAGQFLNVAGKDAGKTAYKTKESGKTKEGSTTDASVPVNGRSLQGGKVR